MLPRHRDRCVVRPMRRPNEHRIVTRLAPLRSTQLPERKRVLVGYAVHSRCWQLVERTIGRSSAETHLGVLMKVLLRRFGELGFGTVRFLKSTENEQGRFVSFRSVPWTELIYIQIPTRRKQSWRLSPLVSGEDSRRPTSHLDCSAFRPLSSPWRSSGPYWIYSVWRILSLS